MSERRWAAGAGWVRWSAYWPIWNQKWNHTVLWEEAVLWKCAILTGAGGGS